MQGKKIKLQIWNVAGHEKFQKTQTAFLRGAGGILLVYDVTDSKTFEREGPLLPQNLYKDRYNINPKMTWIWSGKNTWRMTVKLSN